MKNTDQTFADTKLTLKLGGVDYKLSFGIHARRRIEESQPNFNLLGDSMPDFEIIPFLIQKAIEPEDQKWKSEKEFIELYEACTDENGLEKVLLAYQNAVGFTNQRFAPLISRFSEILSEQTANLAKEKAKSK